MVKIMIHFDSFTKDLQAAAVNTVTYALPDVTISQFDIQILAFYVTTMGEYNCTGDCFTSNYELIFFQPPQRYIQTGKVPAELTILT